MPLTMSSGSKQPLITIFFPENRMGKAKAPQRGSAFGREFNRPIANVFKLVEEFSVGPLVLRIPKLRYSHRALPASDEIKQVIIPTSPLAFFYVRRGPNNFFNPIEDKIVNDRQVFQVLGN